jgi:hypothetical protein
VVKKSRFVAGRLVRDEDVMMLLPYQEVVNQSFEFKDA